MFISITPVPKPAQKSLTLLRGCWLYGVPASAGNFLSSIKLVILVTKMFALRTQYFKRGCIVALNRDFMPKRLSRGEVSKTTRVVAPTSVNGFRFICTLRALGHWSIT
jgi:hypothetical protein